MGSGTKGAGLHSWACNRSKIILRLRAAKHDGDPRPITKIVVFLLSGHPLPRYLSFWDPELVKAAFVEHNKKNVQARYIVNKQSEDYKMCLTELHAASRIEEGIQG